MLVWSAAGILEKNKLANDKPFLILAEITVDGIDEPIRLARNNEDITWNNQLWQMFPFDIDKITEDGKSLPDVALTVSNVGGLIQGYVQEYSGFCDAEVALYIVHAAHLDNTTPEVEFDFVITATKYTEEWITFTLGASGDYSFRFPSGRYITSYCPYHFGDIECGYAGSLTACDNTLTNCRITKRFGGEPGLETAT